MTIRKTFECISAKEGRAVLKPVEGPNDYAGRVWTPPSRLLLEIPDPEIFTNGRRYEVEIRER